MSRPLAHSAIPSTRPAVAGGSLPSAMRHLLSAALGTLLTWRARTRQREVLAELPDYMLADIGITRADVLREVEKPFWTR